MIKIFKYIRYFFQAKKGMNKPDELMTDLSFGIVEGFFVMSLLILGLLAGLAGFLGFYYDSGLLKFFMVLFVLVFIGDLVLLRVLKRGVGRIMKNMTSEVHKRMGDNRIVDVDVDN